MPRKYTDKHPGSSSFHVWFYDVCTFILRRIIFAPYRPIIQGLEHVPDDGAVLLAANHQSYFDPPFVGCWFSHRRHADFVARAGLFKVPLFAQLIRTVNAIPIAEEGSDAAAIRATLEALSKGHAVVIFPEGSRTHNGTIGEYKRGVELLLRRAKCPVIPVSIEGIYDTFPRSAKFPKLFGCRLAIRYGAPIPHQELTSKDASESALERLRNWTEASRLELREVLREATKGRFPPK
ncbi:MAG: lysophospholipid acyltransferase family protein [Planctomycetota bacterium]